jgi:mRNA-degrading endonuclease RelE of RelBE toxin-antitoxin system
MAIVSVSSEAHAQLDHAFVPIQIRIHAILLRLTKWPEVSGAKPLRRELVGNFRLRTGDYRVIVRYDKATDTVIVWKIGYRGGIYDKD